MTRNNKNARRNRQQRDGNKSGQHDGNKSGQRDRKWMKNNNGSRNNQQNKFRQFEKFVDNDRMNYESKYWQQNNRNSDSNRTNNNFFNEQDAGFHPWMANRPPNNLMTPRHINFDDQHERTQQEWIPNNADNIQHRQSESIENKMDPLRAVSREISVPKNDNNNMEATKPRSEVQQFSAPPVTSKNLILTRVKQEKKSSSSESSSSSSSEEEPEHNKKAAVSVKPDISISNTPTSPLNIKLKASTNSVSSNPVKIIGKCEPLPENSSSSSSTSSDEEKQGNPQILKKPETKKQSEPEDDVVCVGLCDNKIVLEDATDNSSTDEEQETETAEKVLSKLEKKSENKAAENCMICDKKGHTSFQCQMICKNCSAPYHGYRTCPHPANLNTMLQLFVEFCMQQLQNFQVEKQLSTSNCSNVPKPKVESSHLTSECSKSSKLKRKQTRTHETNKKHKKSKKRKASASKKSKANSGESSDNDSEDSSDTSETSSSETDEQISDSSDQSLSKKKRKMKTAKNTPKTALDLARFSANSAGLSQVLNGFPHLTLPTASIQDPNPNTSANALNTLFLTQMLQNAIGSLRK